MDPIYPDLKGKVAVVTGAGSGIGRQIAISLSEQGCKVIMLDLNEEGLKETQKTTNSDYYICNVADENNVKEIFDKLDKVDIVVNNAGIALKESYLIADVPLDLWNKIMTVNVTGYFLITKYAEKKFIKQQSGSIIFTCSNAGILGSAANIYGISNSARIGLVKQTALEMAKYGVRSNGVIPGDILEGSGIWDEDYLEQRAEAKGMTVEEAKKYYENRAPLKGKATSKQLANLVLFLASNASENTTGQILKADGGQVMV